MNFSLNIYLDELRPVIDVDCGTFTLDGNKAVADYFESLYNNMRGWNVKRVDCGAAGVGLEVRNKPYAKDIDVMFLGHLDTVFPEGTAEERPMTFDNEKAYGPGVSDMKSGLLNVVYALRNADKEALDKLSICVCMNPDEETGSHYSVDWIESVAKKAKHVLVAEAARADGSLVKARKGLAQYTLKFSGVAAHAGNDPQSGRSAITEMANWILAINNLNSFDTGTTLNVGVVSGGAVANVVPDSAEAILDVRFWENAEYDQIDTQLNTLTSTPFIDGVTISIERTAYKPSMVPTDKTKVLMSMVEEAGQELKIPITWQEVGGGSDANFTAFIGAPTLDGLGPAGAGFHSEAEYLLLESIEPRIKLLISLLNKFAEK